jgi:hypothetical protein
VEVIFVDFVDDVEINERLREHIIYTRSDDVISNIPSNRNDVIVHGSSISIDQDSDEFVDIFS